MADTADFAAFGHHFTALRDGGLYWHHRRALILADLHLEKASWFARAGQMLPPYDTDATIAGVEQLVAQNDPAEIWCLGDSFHDNAGPGRLDPAARERIGAIAQGRRWTWITGNHDARPGALLPGDVIEEARIDGLILRHEARSSETEPELSGHFHPKWRVSIRGRSISRRCFVLSASRLILPAFGAFTGGLDARNRAISALIGPSGEALVPLEGRILRFALHDRRSVAIKDVTF